MGTWVTSMVLVFLLSMVSTTWATNPGLRMRVTQGGLDYAAKEAITVLSGDIQGKHLPDQCGSEDVKVGKVDYCVTNIVITSFTPPTSTVKVDAARGITWIAQGGSLAVHADWKYKYKYHFIKISDHGSMDVSVSGLSFILSVKLGMDATGHPTIAPTGCSADAGDVDVHIHGGASWFYKIFDDQIGKALKKALIKAMCEAANSAITKQASKTLASLKLDVVIDDIMDLDYKLVAPPAFSSGYVDTFHKGEVYWKQQPSEVPFQPGPLPNTTVSNKMMYMYISDYVMNSMLYVLQNHGLLVYNLTQDDLSGSDKDLLNTTCSSVCMGTYLYQVAKLYPNSRMALYAKSSVPPKVSINSGQVNGYVQGTISFHVQLPNKTDVYLFTTNTTVTANLTAAVKDEHRVTGKITQITPQIKLIDTKISDLSDAQLTYVFQTAASLVLPDLNAKLAEGLEIPNADEVHFINPELYLEQGSFMISTDLKYVPDTLYFSPEEM